MIMLRNGGELMVLDLMKHKFDRARELFGDQWLGFAESDLQRWFEAAGFKKIEITVIAREDLGGQSIPADRVGQTGA